MNMLFWWFEVVCNAIHLYIIIVLCYLFFVYIIFCSFVIFTPGKLMIELSQSLFYSRPRWCPFSAVHLPQLMGSWAPSVSAPTSSTIKTKTSLWLWLSWMKLDWLKIHPKCLWRFEQNGLLLTQWLAEDSPKMPLKVWAEWFIINPNLLLKCYVVK